jgi:hypothetical protein
LTRQQQKAPTCRGFRRRHCCLPFPLLRQGWRPDQLWARHARSSPTRHRIRRPHSQRRQAGRSASAGAGEVRACDQSQDRQGARPRNSVIGTRPRRRGDRIECNLLRCICRFLGTLGPREMSHLSPQSAPKRTLSRHRRMTESEPRVGHRPSPITCPGSHARPSQSATVSPLRCLALDKCNSSNFMPAFFLT